MSTPGPTPPIVALIEQMVRNARDSTWSDGDVSLDVITEGLGETSGLVTVGPDGLVYLWPYVTHEQYEPGTGPYVVVRSMAEKPWVIQPERIIAVRISDLTPPEHQR